MKRALLIAPVVVLAAAAPAAAGAAEVQVQGLDSLQFAPKDVTIAAGDTVRWTFAGTTQPHNVAATGGNWTFRTEAGAPPAPDAVAPPFAAPGVYTYVCEIHATTMTGTITVTGAGGAPPPAAAPPPLSTQPFPNDATPPAPLETGGLDTRRPRLSGVSVRRRAGGARVRFRVSESARVTVRFKRGGRTVRTRSVAAAGRETLTVRRLGTGTYRVELRAVDPAGNRAVRRAGLTVR